MPYRITKTYGHDLGLSACFRQWRATSHCRFLHGYALSFKFTFESDTLDHNNWVLDFGGLKPLKQWLCDTFDHKLVVAEDDPAAEMLLSMNSGVYEDQGNVFHLGQLADAITVPFVGCEGFARMAWDQAQLLLAGWQRREVAPLDKGVWLVEVEVREHGANSAIYMGAGN
jgi:6-pyruvoyltetrahydropterin/6-carboxytetrahydropterin synthase